MSAGATRLSQVEDFLAERRQLGYGLRTTGYALRSFAHYVDGLDHPGPLSVELMTAWARLVPGNPHHRAACWARRLKRLRSFARWMQQFDPHTEVPDDTVFGRVSERVTPHIYTEQEMIDLLGAARRLRPALRGATYEVLFGLIAATGVRVSEAVHLLNADVDLKCGMLTVRQSKFAKSRYVALHPSAIQRLRHYRRQRDPHIAPCEHTPFFVSTRGQRLGHALSLRQVRRVFEQLRDQLGWVNRGAHAQARIHDLRHAFIVRRVLLWQAEGVDIDQAMLALSTYVGHASVTNTYWYLTGVPELMALAASKFEPRLASQEGSDV
jgi:integrase